MRYVVGDAVFFGHDLLWHTSTPWQELPKKQVLLRCEAL